MPWKPLLLIYNSGICLQVFSYYNPVYSTAASSTQCDIQLLTQPAGINGDPGLHTIISVLTKVNSYTLPATYYEAGPVDKSGNKTLSSPLTVSIGRSWLDLLVPPITKYGHDAITYPLPTKEFWQTGFSAANCTKSTSIAKDAARFPQNHFGYFIFDQNSNGFTRSLLSMVGLNPVFPKGAVGSGTKLSW